MNTIIYNAIKCNHCKEEIASTHRHDFRVCKCDPWKVAVDGGRDYLKRCGNQEDYTEMFLGRYSPFIKIREHLKLDGYSDHWIQRSINHHIHKDESDWVCIYLQEKLYRAEQEY